MVALGCRFALDVFTIAQQDRPLVEADPLLHTPGSACNRQHWWTCAIVVQAFLRLSFYESSREPERSPPPRRLCLRSSARSSGTGRCDTGPVRAASHVLRPCARCEYPLSFHCEFDVSRQIRIHHTIVKKQQLVLEDRDGSTTYKSVKRRANNWVMMNSTGRADM